MWLFCQIVTRRCCFGVQRKLAMEKVQTKAYLCNAQRRENNIALRKTWKIEICNSNTNIISFFASCIFQCFLFGRYKNKCFSYVSFLLSFLAPRPRKTKQTIQELAMEKEKKKENLEKQRVIVMRQDQKQNCIEEERKIEICNSKMNSFCYPFCLNAFFNVSSVGITKLCFFHMCPFCSSFLAPRPRKTTRRRRGNAKMRHACGAECLRARSCASRSSSSLISKWARCCLQAAKLPH